MTDIEVRNHLLLLIILVQCFTNFIFFMQKEQWKHMADRTLEISKKWEASSKNWESVASGWRLNSESCLDSLDKSVKETNKAIRLLGDK